MCVINTWNQYNRIYRNIFGSVKYAISWNLQCWIVVTHFHAFILRFNQWLGWCGTMSQCSIQQKNGPVTTEIAILNLERMTLWHFNFIGKKLKMSHTMVFPSLSLDHHIFCFQTDHKPERFLYFIHIAKIVWLVATYNKNKCFIAQMPARLTSSISVFSWNFTYCDNLASTQKSWSVQFTC